ncbi:MAG: sulfide-dependent adenosine diphosphate thiazole synthase [Bacteroidales bacterium]|nr:sulfide-dependent adenosine diphosphate thiazole synthase [Bacteroidales bacterium]
MEKLVSLSIVEHYFEKLKSNLELDVAIVGAGPSGMVAGYYLAKKGHKVAVFERKLAPGGGMWGGAMMFNEIVVQNDAVSILDELNVFYRRYDESCVVVDSIHATSALIYACTRAGCTIFNCFSVEDVVFKNDRVAGIVVNWTPVHLQQLHVDPLIVLAKAVLDGTGHDCDIAKTLVRKNDVRLMTETGGIVGERSLQVEEAERKTIENTKEIYPGLFVAGMAANGVSGSFRMGPIFGGMLLSGKKVANLIEQSL